MAVLSQKLRTMVDKPVKMAVLSQIKKSGLPLTLPQISTLLTDSIPERTLRRWLVAWVESGLIKRTGKKRGTRYQAIVTPQSDNESHTFLRHIPEYRRAAILEQIRDLWTHHSTALEGNTLTLGDTHAILGMGLTISGKPLREHQEIVGHAKAIDILYECMQKPLTKSLVFKLHKAVQVETIRDIYKPVGEWKIEVNGTYAVTSTGEQTFIEYALPIHVDELMQALIQSINSVDITTVTLTNAASFYAKIHMAVVHIHAFFDGNGRVARLLSNIILLKAGFPPLVIDNSLRREYIECLADYQVKAGQLTNTTGLWPENSSLDQFNAFCEKAYTSTKILVENGSNKSNR